MATARQPLLPAILLAASLCAWTTPSLSDEAPEEEPELLELMPEDAPSWSMTNVMAPLTTIFLGLDYWYEPRVVTVETTPPGAALDLFYVRRNFQKVYEQADSPVRLVLPPRIEATSRDSITIRALLGGYRQREVRFPVRSGKSEVMIDLSPLPNGLVAFTHTYFAGRGSLTFLTKEALAFRVQKAPNGFGVVLTETATTPEATEMVDAAQSALVESARAQQLGEDLLVRVELSERGRSDHFETRSRQSVDPIRGLHTFALDLVPKDGGASDIERALDALAQIGPEDVTGCAADYDVSLREQLDPAALARALSPNSSYRDRYLGAAMKRLGEVSPGGVIQMADGTQYRGAIPIERMAAASQPGEAIGYLALLRRFVALLESGESQRNTLRGLVAPELAPSAFDAIDDAAIARERSCPSRNAGSPTAG